MTTVAELFAGRGGSFHDETVTQTEHALQTAALAEAEGAPPSLVVAALLHDVGHRLADEHAGRDGFLDADAEHERLGADLLRRWFGDEVTGPVALHVPAKLRRWDDRAKVPGLRPPPWEHYASTLASAAQNNQVFDF